MCSLAVTLWPYFVSKTLTPFYVCQLIDSKHNGFMVTVIMVKVPCNVRKLHL